MKLIKKQIIINFFHLIMIINIKYFKIILIKKFSKKISLKLY